MSDSVTPGLSTRMVNGRVPCASSAPRLGSLSLSSNSARTPLKMASPSDSETPTAATGMSGQKTSGFGSSQPHSLPAEHRSFTFFQ